jgi:hypothetical protein
MLMRRRVPVPGTPFRIDSSALGLIGGQRGKQGLFIRRIQPTTALGGSPNAVDGSKLF